LIEKTPLWENTYSLEFSLSEEQKFKNKMSGNKMVGAGQIQFLSTPLFL
jgi:hypothetical protein